MDVLTLPQLEALARTAYDLDQLRAYAAARPHIRWVAARKLTLVKAVRARLISVSRLNTEFGISPEEYAEWERRVGSDLSYDIQTRKRLRATRGDPARVVLRRRVLPR